MTTTMNAQVSRFVPLAKRVAYTAAKRFQPGDIDRDRLLSASLYAIVQALETYNPHRCKLKTWITCKCRWAVGDEIRLQIGRRGRPKRRPIPHSLAWQSFPDEQPPALDDDFDRDDLRTEAERLIDSVDLTPLERDMIRARIVSMDPLHVVADDFRCRPSVVSRRTSAALAKLRHHYREATNV